MYLYDVTLRLLEMITAHLVSHELSKERRNPGIVVARTTKEQSCSQSKEPRDDGELNVVRHEKYGG